MSVPPQLLTGAGDDPPEISRPAGSESLNPMPPKGILPVFWMVMVSAVLEPGVMGFDPKNLLMLTPGRFVKEASAGSTVVTPFAVVTAPAGTTFVKLPLTVMVTLRVNVQLPKGDRLPPLKEKELSPGVPVSVPPQVPTLKFIGLARIIPLGILSVNVISVSVSELELRSLILIVEADPPKTVNGSKPLTTAMA